MVSSGDFFVFYVGFFSFWIYSFLCVDGKVFVFYEVDSNIKEKDVV